MRDYFGVRTDRGVFGRGGIKEWHQKKRTLTRKFNSWAGGDRTAGYHPAEAGFSSIQEARDRRNTGSRVRALVGAKIQGGKGAQPIGREIEGKLYGRRRDWREEHVWGALARGGLLQRGPGQKNYDDRQKR